MPKEEQNELGMSDDDGHHQRTQSQHILLRIDGSARGGRGLEQKFGLNLILIIFNIFEEIINYF